MRKTIKVALVALCILFMVGVSAQAEVGVTDTTIKIGTVVDEDGPAAFMGKRLRHGMMACFNRINDEGGIHGRKLVTIFESDGYNPPRAIAAVKKLMERDKVFCFVGNLGSAPNMATAPLINEAKIPHIAPITASTGIVVPPKRYIFGTFSLRTDIGRSFMDYAVDDLKLKGKKMGFIGIDDSYGKDFYTGVKEQAVNYGIKLAAVEWYKRGAVDLSANVLNLKKAGVEVIFMVALTKHAALIIKETAKLGWKPQFLHESGGSNPKTIELAGKENCEGIISNKAYPLIEGEGSDAAGVQMFVKDLKKYYPDVPADDFSIAGYMVAHFAELAFRETGRNLTREGLVATLSSWKDKDTGFIPLTFGKTNRTGANRIFFTRIKDGKYIKISDWRGPKKF